MSKSFDTGDVYIKPSRDIAARVMVDEMVIMSVKDSKVFSLNPSATLIWSAADGATPLREIVARTMQRLRECGAPLVGVVMNNTDQELHGYYYYPYKYSYYHKKRKGNGAA